MVRFDTRDQAWYAEFLLEIDLKILMRKTGARLILKIELKSLHINPARKNFSLRLLSKTTEFIKLFEIFKQKCPK
jgi:hypothetical protein